jgi:MYXO-CTERM domain-containing protein
MLGACGIIANDESAQIVAGLEQMLAEHDIGFHPESTVERVDPKAGQIVLADGRTIWVDNDDVTSGWSYDEGGGVTVEEDPDAEPGTMARLRADLPGSDQAEQLYEDRAAVQTYDNRPHISEVLAAHNEAVLGGTPFEREEGCACALGASPPGAPAMGILLGFAVLLRRRRRAGRAPTA